MRNWLHKQLSPSIRDKPGLSAANRAIAAIIVLAITLSILETEKEFVALAPATWRALDVAFAILFSTEYVLRVWVAAEIPKYQGFFGRVRYIFSPIAIVDLLAIAPFYFTLGVQDAFMLRLFRLLRLVALAKLGRYSTALRNIASALSARRYELLMSLVAAFLVMLLSATALHISEASANPESFGSVPRALWWGVATVTKVGYGGAFPVTVVGKMFAAVFAVAAIGVVALPTGILAAAFSDAFQRERERRRTSLDLHE